MLPHLRRQPSWWWPRARARAKPYSVPSSSSAGRCTGYAPPSAIESNGSGRAWPIRVSWSRSANNSWTSSARRSSAARNERWFVAAPNSTGLQRRLLARHPRAVLGRARAELGPVSVRLATAVRFDLDRRRARLGAQTSRLEALSPLAVLARGYAIAEVGDGTILRHPGQVRPGDQLSLRLARGRVDATVVRTDDQE